MIIDKVSIRNFRSYYGGNEFEFKDGLTLIIGDNGDGKTTFFEALEWLFNTAQTEDKTERIVSAKRKKELYDAEKDSVCVTMYFKSDDDSEKIVEKSIDFARNGDNITMSNFQFNGYDCIGSERVLRSGKQMLDACFDSYMRRYCLFKGENNLNVFDDDNALQTLVEKFSDIREFDSYVALTDYMEETSEKAYKKELSADDKNKSKVKDLEMRMVSVSAKIRDTQSDLKKQEDAASDYQVRIEDLERNQEASERYQEVKSRLANLNEKRIRLEHQSTENYNLRLLDDEWILCAFPGILKEYQEKVAKLARTKRKMNDEYIAQQAKLRGKQEAYVEMTTLANGATALPWDLPDLQTMQEMIDEHICKVCGREAPEGSPAYEFMLKKIENYKRHLEAQKKEAEEKLNNQPLFSNSYINEVRNLGISLGGDESVRISNYAQEIKENIEFVAARKLDLQKVMEQIEEAEEERKRIIIQADGISENLLEKNFHDLKGFFDEKKKADDKIAILRGKLSEYLQEKAAIDEEFNQIAPSKGMTKVYRDVHTVLDKIARAFKSAREKNLRRFLSNLSDHANHYLQSLNPGDFHGTVNIIERANGKAKINLVSSNGEHIDNPNGALRTTMYMSILFAISDLTTIKREEDYPLIFDAPTSSFGEMKEDVFYNIIAGIKKQCIIVTKDLLEKDEITGGCRINQQKLNNLQCSVYRIEKAKPFDQNDLSTIKINITKIKN